jgi:hypothetical protein
LRRATISASVRQRQSARKEGRQLLRQKNVISKNDFSIQPNRRRRRTVASEKCRRTIPVGAYIHTKWIRPMALVNKSRHLLCSRKILKSWKDCKIVHYLIQCTANSPSVIAVNKTVRLCMYLPVFEQVPY